jgi:hypothetical protein
MLQDPKKEAKDIQKPSVKERLARYIPKKKVGVGEMGKPDFKSGFEAAMQKERNTVLNRAKERDKDPDWYKKESAMQKERGGKENLTRFVKNVKEEDGKERLTRMVKDVKEVGIGKAILGNLESSAERLAGGAAKAIEKMSGLKKPKLLKSMSKKPKYDF